MSKKANVVSSARKSSETGERALRDAAGGRVAETISAAARAGLSGAKNARISGRVSRTLLDQAKKRTGLVSNTELLEFALASLALEDKFPEAFREAQGTVDPSLDLSF